MHELFRPDVSGLSKAQTRVFEALAAWIQREGWAPSIVELAEAVGLRSASTVHMHLHELQRLGKIKLGQFARQIVILQWQPEGSELRDGSN